MVMDRIRSVVLLRFARRRFLFRPEQVDFRIAGLIEDAKVNNRPLIGFGESNQIVDLVEHGGPRELRFCQGIDLLLAQLLLADVPASICTRLCRDPKTKAK